MTAPLAAGLALLPIADDVPPLTPDSDEARRWAEQELSDPAYTVAQPNFFDRIARAIAEFFSNLFSTDLQGGWGPTLAIVAAIVVVVIVVAAFLVWGLPRTRQRAPAATADLFGGREERSAQELRRAAAAAAARGAWDDAIVLRFRALARGLAERGVVETPPGTTVHGFARAVTRVFPARADELEAAAAAFDDVRYLRRRGTAQLYERVAAVDDAVASEHAPLTVRQP